MKTRPILLVDDSPNDRELTLEGLKGHGLLNQIETLDDGAECLDYLYRRGQFLGRSSGNPVLILLDLKMPRIDGLEVLREIKSDPKLMTIPVIVMTSSKEACDVVDSYNFGVNAYVVKPLNFENLGAAVKAIGAFWAVLNEPPVDTNYPF